MDPHQKHITIRIAAAPYADSDDSLAAAARDVTRLYRCRGYTMNPRWESEERDHILLDVPAWSAHLRETLEDKNRDDWAADTEDRDAELDAAESPDPFEPE